MRLNICTPLSRQKNLDLLFLSVRDLIRKDLARWWIVDDVPTGVHSYVWTYEKPNVRVINAQKKGALAGHAHRNQVLDYLLLSSAEEWFMSLDDDNVLHPNFARFYENFVLSNRARKFRGIIFDQIDKRGNLRLKADPNKVQVGNIDTAQYLFDITMLFYTDHDYIRFDEERYDADGVLIEQMYKNHPDKFLIINEPLCYYNYLR